MKKKKNQESMRYSLRRVSRRFKMQNKENNIKKLLNKNQI